MQQPLPLNRKMLVPVDGSENAKTALKFAVGLARTLRDTIVVLHVIPHFDTPNTKRFFDKKTIGEYQQQLFEETIAPYLQALQMAGVPFSTKMRIGSPREQILEEALPLHRHGLPRLQPVRGQRARQRQPGRPPSRQHPRRHRPAERALGPARTQFLFCPPNSPN